MNNVGLCMFGNYYNVVCTVNYHHHTCMFQTKPDFKSRAHQLLARSSYSDLLRLLWRNSKSARRAMIDVVGANVTREMTRCEDIYISENIFSPIYRYLNHAICLWFVFVNVRYAKKKRQPTQSGSHSCHIK